MILEIVRVKLNYGETELIFLVTKKKGLRSFLNELSKAFNPAYKKK